MKIEELALREIFDSRGESTLECELKTPLGNFYASVPAGKSTGVREVEVFNFITAKKALPFLRRAILEKDFSSVREFDSALLHEDSTSKKSKIGGNVALGFSMAFARARAAEKNISLWLLLRREFFPKVDDNRRPSIFSNFINGGAHAKSGLDIQEYMVVVRPGKNYTEDIRLLIELYAEAGNRLRKKTGAVLPVGDESGYAVSFSNNFEPITFLSKLLTAHKLGKKCSIALDAAATHFFSGKGLYQFDGKSYSSKALSDLYFEWFKKSKFLCSLEDPFSENDEEAFHLLQKRLKSKWVVGDDLTTTNAARIQALGSAGTINAVIIKPNQIGTVSETCDALSEAKQLGLKTIISHRSGETEDVFIISLARAAAADGVKIGAPARERMAKFNELIRLYEE